jgi:hypothetical protein
MPAKTRNMFNALRDQVDPTIPRLRFHDWREKNTVLKLA